MPDVTDQNQPLKPRLEIDIADPGMLGGCVYYSQNREDLVLLSFFPTETDGFYIDVGAFDPDVDSVTKLFYLKGWRGINVEPQKEQYERFVKERPRDTNLNVGISDHNDTLKLRTYPSGGLSTFSGDIKNQYEARPDDDTREYVEHEVAVRPLKDVLAEQNVGRISFLKVDVEGLEYEVLQGNDWNAYRPEVICIESNHILDKDWRPLLREQGYSLVFNDGLNDYYADDRTDRAAKFDYVKEVVHDRGGGIRAEHYQMLADLYNYGSQKTNHVHELEIRLEEIIEARKQSDESLTERQQDWNSIKRTARRLIVLLRARLTGGAR